MLQVSPPTQVLHTTSRRTHFKSQHTRPPTHQTHAAKPDKRVKSSVRRYTYSPGAVARHMAGCVDCAGNYITCVMGKRVGVDSVAQWGRGRGVGSRLEKKSSAVEISLPNYLLRICENGNR